jgi:iron complex transport system ATP-binding protein
MQGNRRHQGGTVHTDRVGGSTEPSDTSEPAERSARPAPLAAEGLDLAYDQRMIVEGLDVEIPDGRITVIVGANACGKSTLLRGLARLLRPRGGVVLLDGQDVQRLPTKVVATRMGLLPQSPNSPEGITVADLVARGRYPHQKWFRQWTAEDEAAVAQAMARTNTSDLAERSVDELSGGQRQRVWIALALAQDTPLMLLDEPTTYLDLAHQVEVLDLLADLNEHEGRTIVLVLHDLNLACRYAHHLIAMRGGSVVTEGTPAEVMTTEVVEEVFGLRARIIDDPLTGTPLVLPLPRSTAAAAGTVEADGAADARAEGLGRST